MARVLDSVFDQYPRLAIYVQRALKELANDPEVGKAVALHTNMSATTARVELKKADKGPAVDVRELNKKFQDAVFNPSIDKDKIFINKSRARFFERNSDDPHTKKFIKAKILQEFGHWAEHHWRRGSPADYKAGDKIEKEVFDSLVPIPPTLLAELNL